jgi:hypothetical protein
LVFDDGILLFQLLQKLSSNIRELQIQYIGRVFVDPLSHIKKCHMKGVLELLIALGVGFSHIVNFLQVLLSKFVGKFFLIT